MNKITKLTEIPISIKTHRVVISENIFKEIVSKLEAQTETINALIDLVEELFDKNSQLQDNINENKAIIQELARAISILGGN